MAKVSNIKAIKASQHHLKKSLGQNFINNHQIIDKIINLIDDQYQAIVEIGPGIGALTEGLITLNKPLLAIELDQELIPLLTNKFKNDDNFTLLHQDCLKVTNKEITSLLNVNENIILVANIPYYITSPIISKIIKELNSVNKAILMVQDEVAKRICSTNKHKTYGSLSVFVQSYCDVKYEFLVKKENFYPIPKVNSAIISIERKTNKQIIDEQYLTFVNNCFLMKRKTLLNNLVKAYHLDKALINKVLMQHDLALDIRAEEISVNTFILLYQAFKKILGEI